MVETTSGQVSTSAARVYEEMFVPALFRQWPPRLLDRVEIGPGTSVLDVACGTGVLAREAAVRAGAEHVAGVDVNEGMLAMARESAPGITWQSGDAQDLPFDEASFQVVGCQFALMFFGDRVQALREMWRVLAPGGSLVVAVWDSLEASPGYRAWIGLVEEELGPDAATGLRSPFVLGELDELRELFHSAGITGATIETVDGWASFESIDRWVEIDIRGWILDREIDDAMLSLLQEKARDRLAEFVDPEGRPAFRAPAHIVVGRKS